MLKPEKIGRKTFCLVAFKFRCQLCIMHKHAFSLHLDARYCCQQLPHHAMLDVILSTHRRIQASSRIRGTSWVRCVGGLISVLSRLRRGKGPEELESRRLLTTWYRRVPDAQKCRTISTRRQLSSGCQGPRDRHVVCQLPRTCFDILFHNDFEYPT